MKHLSTINSTINFTIGFLLLICFSTIDASANSKSEELQRKIADLGLLTQQLEDRRQQAEAILASLLSQRNDLVSEVRLLQKRLNFKSYDQVAKYDRARYNIDLLRTITAYTDKIANKIKVYKTGKDKLTYLQQLAEDDIKMIRTLNDFEIDALTTQISLVINRYLGEAHIIQIDPKNIELVAPESVWESIVKGRY
jgi:hypothetical protein